MKKNSVTTIKEKMLLKLAISIWSHGKKECTFTPLPT